MSERNWCWPFRHQWSKWIDLKKGTVETIMATSKAQTGIFIEQERRCAVCGKVQLRHEVSNL